MPRLHPPHIAAAAAVTAALAKISARRRHGKKKKIFTKTWKTNKLQKTLKKSMENLRSKAKATKTSKNSF